jgi:hypothetical protein
LAYYNRKAGIIHLLKEQIIYATGSILLSVCYVGGGR